MIQEIELSKLKNHPMNVRRTYADIDELADSIKKNGVMQNLTVIPDQDQEGCYLVVIGNRRLLAAQKAGLQTVPCQITDMDQKTVAETMLLENMQRNDLSIVDQAYGFQLCLDLGDTASDIAEKTGLSKQTVKHRIEIARLDEDSLERRYNDPNFQLTMTDLIALEKIKNVDKRNEILNSAYSSAEMRRLAENAARDEKREEEAKKVLGKMAHIDIHPAPKKFEGKLYYTDVLENIAEFNLDGVYSEDYEKEQIKKVEEAAASPKRLYYMTSWQRLHIVREADKKEKTKPVETAKERRTKAIKAFCQQMKKDRDKYVQEILEGKHKNTEKPNCRLISLINAMFETGADCGYVPMAKAYKKKSYWELSNEEKEDLREKVAKADPEQKCLIAIFEALEDKSTIDWRDNYAKDQADALFAGYEILADYGYTLTTEEIQILSGTHDLYKEDSDEKGN